MFKKSLLTIVILCLPFGALRTELPKVYLSEQEKFIVSKFGQIFVPATVIGLLIKLENNLAKHYPEQFKLYNVRKGWFYRQISATKVGSKMDNFLTNINPSIVKDWFHKAVAHPTWFAATNAPFIGLKVLDPALIFYTLMQLITQENPAIQKHTIPFFYKLFPEYFSSFDFSVKDNFKISLYRNKSGHIRVQESIWSKHKGFIENIKYSRDGKTAEIFVSRHQLALFPHESEKIVVSLNDPKIVDLSQSNFRIINGKWQFDGSAWKWAGRAKDEVGNMIWDLNLNNSGRKALGQKLAGLATFLVEDGGVGYRRPFAEAAEKFTRVIVASNVAWPFFEIGRQLLSSGALNLVPLFNNWGFFTSFIIGGMSGSAAGSRIPDIATWAGLKIDRGLHRIFPNLKPNRFTSRIVSDGSCLGLLKQLSRGAQVLGYNSELTLETVRAMLANRYGTKYWLVSKVIAGVVGGSLAYGLPKAYTSVSEHILDLFRDKTEDPDDPHSLSMFPPSDGVSHHLFSGGVDADYSRTTVVDPDAPPFEQFSQVAENVIPAFMVGTQAQVAQAEELFNEENEIATSQLDTSAAALTTLYNMEADAVSDTLAQYEDDPEAQKALLWFLDIMMQPVVQIRDMQMEYITKISEATSVNELRNIFYEFMELNKLEDRKVDTYQSFSENMPEDSEPLDYIAERIVSFITLADVTIFAHQIGELQLQEEEEAGGEESE